MRLKLVNQALALAVALVTSLSLAGCGIGKVSISNSCLGPCTAPPTAEFLYATSTDHILAFTMDPATGALSTPLTMTGPNQSVGMVASVTNGHLYVSDFLNDAVDGFSINSSTGGLTPVTGSPFSLGGMPPGAGGLSNIPPGDFYVYATDLNAAAVAGFRFDSVSGVPTPVPGSPFPAGNTPIQAAQDFLSKFLYVSNLNDSAGGISAFTIDQSTGALSPIPGSPFPTGSAGSFPGPSAMVVNNNFLYVAMAGTVNANNKIVAFAIDPNTGALSTLPSSPFATGSDPLYIAFVPVTLSSQAFLYTANVLDGTISAFTADDNTGLLTPVSGSPYASGTSLGGLAVSLFTGAVSGPPFLYAADPQSKAVRVYAIDGNTGALSAIPGSPFPAGNSPQLLTVAAGQ